MPGPTVGPSIPEEIRMNATSPVIKTMQVIPVAGYDSMLMTLSGAHAPCFTATW